MAVPAHGSARRPVPVRKDEEADAEREPPGCRTKSFGLGSARPRKTPVNP
jgi:hypothetical protein